MHFDEYRRYFDEQGPGFATGSEQTPSRRERVAVCERPLGNLGLAGATSEQPVVATITTSEA